MEIDGWMNACFDVNIHVFHSFIILKRIIETVYMYPVTKWGEILSVGSKSQPEPIYN